MKQCCKQLIFISQPPSSSEINVYVFVFVCLFFSHIDTNQPVSSAFTTDHKEAHMTRM